MRSRLHQHSRRLVTLLLAIVGAELVYVCVSFYVVEAGGQSGQSVSSRISTLFGASALSALSSLTVSADPNRMLPGLVSGSRVRLQDRLLAYALPSADNGRLRKPAIDDLVEYYGSWKFDTAVRYVIPCTLSQTFLGRLQRPIRTLQDLFPDSQFVGSRNQDILDEPQASDSLQIDNAEFPLRTYNYDPRAPTAIYYDEILNFVKTNGGAGFPVDSVTGKQYPLFENLTVPFSWYDWTDSQILNGFIDLPQTDKPHCSDVVRRYFQPEKLLEFERRFGYKLFEEDRSKALGASRFSSISAFAGKNDEVPPENNCIDDFINTLMPGFRSTSPLNFSRPELYGLQARATLFASKPSAYSLTFLNRNGSSIQVETSNIDALDSKSRPQNVLFNGLLEKYMERNIPSFPEIPASDHSFDNIQKFKQLKQEIFHHFSERSSNNDPSATQSSKTPTSSSASELPYFVELTEKDFEFDAKAKIKQLEALPKRTRHQQSYLESLEGSLNTLTMDLNKYFTEASHVTDYTHMGHHFDSRFFRGAVEHSDMRARLDAIARAWLNFVHSNGLSAWLSHGTLYGWMYNGMAFPWDGDHDMQMPIVHLNILAERFNQSLIVEDPEVGNGRFFLDVSNSITSRVHGNGNNNIDARFIDVDSGLYVDITGLSVSSDGFHPRYKGLAEEVAKSSQNQTFFRDPNIVKGVTDLSPADVLQEEEKRGNMTSGRLNHIERYAQMVKNVQNGHQSESPEQRYNMNKAMKVYNCRNNHFSHLSELSPLRLTFFHGAKAYIPNQAIKELKHEYGVPANYSYLDFSGRAFVPEFRQWVDRSTLLAIAEAPSSPIRVEEKVLKTLDFRSIVALFQNAAVVNDDNVEKFFNYLLNTFQMTTFRQKELELMYDEDRSLAERASSLENFVRNRVFTGGYKDPFQNRLETVVWYNLLDRTPVSYQRLDKHLKKQNLQNADRLLELNVLNNQGNFPWSTEAGYQDPPSLLDFNHRGSRFFAMGENSHNDIFKSDPKDLWSSSSSLSTPTSTATNNA
ncbi:LAME_0D04390g1_1 [Lachancea meyersii CBS 8951]|uniref:LAME_0D04390g1_1 n=1 Tax=Lachancea meyersii CBS 8951 TaxID=1266667 RepID=A0A1G4J829_9SACH|nr:LAME_0D04390g1_1 [Lachancea meyersii CBS 8951]